MSPRVSDPGWRPAFPLALRTVVFPVGLLSGRRPALHGLRAMYLAAPIQLLGLLSVLTFLLSDPGARRPASYWPLIVMGFGAESLLVVSLIAAKGFPTKNLADEIRPVGAAARAVFAISYAFAMSPALIAFVGVFASESGIGPYGLGLPFSAVALILAAPTERRIAAMTNRLRLRNSSVDVLEALMLPDSELQLPRRRRRS